MEFNSINPYNGEKVGQYAAITEVELTKKLENSNLAFHTWRKVPILERAHLMQNAAQVLLDNIEELAKMITLEMGKPIAESRGEIKKCAWVCTYYAENAVDFLQDEVIPTDARQSFVRHEPIGTVLAIMPWNFPFWQVFRFAAPTLIAGNVGLLKHAPNVFGCAQLIEEVFVQAGFPKGVFQNLIVHHDVTEQIIAHDAVQAVTLTGSEKAGSAVAAIAGKHLKKSVLELGGSNAFMVWSDANIEEAVQTAVVARMLNTGQSCIAAKRFIVLADVYDEFVAKFTEAVKRLKGGEPLADTTEVGPLARLDLAEQLERQVKESLALGAKLVLGGNRTACYFEPTILGEVTVDMPAFTQETFGPLAVMVRAESIEEAFQLSEASRFGLGATVFTKNIDKALEMISEVSDGAYFINELVKSDPRLPFGGTKYSGYGRELSKDGILEFVNRKTVYLK